jgi:ribonuclease G
LNKELVINATPEGVVLALLQDKQLIELHQEKTNNSFSVGDIYLGRIKKIMPGLNAAFVDVGYEKDAFLHYLDLGSQVQTLLKYTKRVRTAPKNEKISISDFPLESDINKSGKITEILGKNLLIPVQIAKEPISSKGPRLSAEISLAGRYVVLVPFSDVISVSKKIKSAGERNRLKKIIESVKPKNFGVIIRTVSENKGVAELHNDLKELVERWNTVSSKIVSTEPAKRMLGEIDKTSTVLRDMLNASFNNVHINDATIFEEVKTYIHQIAPEQDKIVKHYRGKEPMFDHFGIDRQIKNLFGKTVNLPGGAYLIIEHTEALHVIDVNSGNRNTAEVNQEENALQVNMEAAKEIARQLRLRDMGGIIVIDFIDMHKASNKKVLFDHLKELMNEDRAKHTILPPSKFGLVQVTRQRVRPEMNIVTVEKCPSCGGSGEIRASIVLLDEIESNLNFILNEQNEKGISLTVHPFIEAYLKKGFISQRFKWFLKYKKWIKIKGLSGHHYLEFHFYNSKEEEIVL